MTRPKFATAHVEPKVARLEGADDQLRGMLKQFEAELAKLRSKPRVFSDDAHARVDRSVERAMALLDEHLKDTIVSAGMQAAEPVIPTGIGDLVALLDPNVAERWHELIDAQPDTFAGSRAEYEAEATRLRAEIDGRQHELDLREAEADEAAAKARVARLRGEARA